MSTAKTLTVVDTIKQMEPQFKLALPSHIPADRFTRTAMTAINSNPDLLKDNVDKRTLMMSVMKAAQDGLILDGKEAALVTFGGMVSYMPMIAGVLKKIRNSGDVSHPVVQIVYSNDVFHIDFVTDTVPVTHQPPKSGPRGEIIGFYAVAKLKDGNWTTPEYMSKEQVDEIRDKFSKQATGSTWTKSYGEMGRKTVLRRAAKYWPTSSDVDHLLSEDGEDDSVINMTMSANDQTYAAPIEAPAAPAPRITTRAAEAVKSMTKADVIDATVIDNNDGPPI